MNLFINPVFWGTASTIYILLLLEIPRSLATRFGLYNFLALFILLGWQAAIGSFALTLFIWLTLYLHKTSTSKSKNQTIIGFSILFAFAILFIFHKWHHESEAFRFQVEHLIPWGRPDIVFPILITLSFSYIFLRLIDLIISVVWNNMKLLNPLALMGYIVPFHMLLAGPINIYREHLEVDAGTTTKLRFNHLLSAVNEISTGLFYKFVIAEGIRIYLYGINGIISVSTWRETALFVIYLFFDFAGYSKMARGLGCAYGIPTPKNFSLPFLSISMTEFWTRWHISLGDFIRRNIFTPIQLQLVRKFGLKWAQQTNLLTLIISFSFVGIWHRLTWGYLVWGVAMGIILAIEKSLRDSTSEQYQKPNSFLKIAHHVIGPVYVFIILTTSIFFVANELIGIQ